MKIGDEVRFLNTKGGGIIKGFQGKDVILVEDETGFEIPMLTKECILISGGNKDQVKQVNKPQPNIQYLARTEEPEEEYEIIETKEGEQISVYLAYLANDIKNLGASDFECYLVNDSNYFLFYNYMSAANKGWISRENGIVEPNTKIFIEEFLREDLNEIETICFQFIAYKDDKSYEFKQPVSQEIRIDTTKFYKLHSFKENDFFDENAIIYTVVEKDKTKNEIPISPEKLQEAMMTKDTDRPKRQRIEKKEKSKTIEVDLHAHEILETTAGLDNTAILEYQLKVFRDVMEENKKNKGQRIVFIHGKGEGVLKNAIADELRKNYKTFTFQDASFQEYGFGATMVIIR